MPPSGSLLRDYRWNRGWTQVELARRADISAKHLSELERGKKRGGVKVWKQLADALSLTVFDLSSTPREKAS